MNRDKAKGVLIGFVAAFLVFGMAATAFGSVGSYQLLATFSNISIVVDGEPFIPQDVNGTYVEPFIVNGTTYLPVRAVAEALGKDVEWNGSEKTVYIGEPPELPEPETPPKTEQPVQTPETALKKWLSENGSDFSALLEEYFGEGTKVYTSAAGAKLTLEISKTTKTQATAEEKAQLEREFIQGLAGVEADYHQILDLIRDSTGYKQITMDVWHYFNESLVYTQELR
ncbi:MAG: copper amine oxidase N-terminal domain-containing protein [Clostridiales Family XIII bacterium]|jgi:hypothetical protein|nr:copper amine oxidase N-terminal domain-containing protein [Clostridiales Family XIII bacterium]